VATEQPIDTSSVAGKALLDMLGVCVAGCRLSSFGRHAGIRMPANQLSHTPNTFRAEQQGALHPRTGALFLVTYMTLLWSDCHSTGRHRYPP
jgi:hypothetical protein